MPTNVPTYDEHVALLALVQANRDLLESVLRSLDDIELRLKALEPAPNTPPVITLLGDNPVSMVAGDDYHEQGATAYDTEDGGLPVSIAAADLNKPGTYELTYTATDSGGLSATATRTVIVNAPLPPSPGTDVAAKLARPLVTPDRLRLIGNIAISAGPSSGYIGSGPNYKAAGAIAIEHGAGNERFLTQAGHSHNPHYGYRLRFTTDQFGNTSSNLGARPKTTLSWNGLIADKRTARHGPGLDNPNGVFSHAGQQVAGVMHLEDDVYLSTGYGHYATSRESQVGPFISKFSRLQGKGTRIVSTTGGVNNRPRYGGGMMRIPQWFAEAFLDGKTLGLIHGGYRSGQGTSHGPTFAALPMPSSQMVDETLDGIELMAYPWEGWPMPDGKSNFDCRAKRPPDYHYDAYSNLYRVPPENGVGAWQWDQVGGAFWVDTDTTQGLCFLATQGIGLLKYDFSLGVPNAPPGKLQYLCCSPVQYLRLYVYDPNDIVRVIRGELTPYEIQGQYYEFAKPGIGERGNLNGLTATGCAFDPVDELVYILWNGGNSTPFVSVCEVK